MERISQVKFLSYSIHLRFLLLIFCKNTMPTEFLYLSMFLSHFFSFSFFPFIPSVSRAHYFCPILITANVSLALSFFLSFTFSHAPFKKSKSTVYIFMCVSVYVYICMCSAKFFPKTRQEKKECSRISLHYIFLLFSTLIQT